MTHFTPVRPEKSSDCAHSVGLSQTSASSVREEFVCSHATTSPQLLAADSTLHTLELPLITKLDRHSPLSTSDPGKCAKENESPYPPETCSRPVSETNCLSSSIADHDQELAPLTDTSSGSPLANAWVSERLSCGSCRPSAPTLDGSTLHASIPSDTDVLASGLQNMKLCASPRDSSTPCR